MDAIYERRSIRKYHSKSVPKEIITELVQAGAEAPSAKNRQPWKYIVFAGEIKDEMLDKMKSGLNETEKELNSVPEAKAGIADAKNTLRIMREAPVIILVLNTNGKSPFVPVDVNDRITEICDTLSIGASIQNILLKANEKGLGTLWIANTCYAYKELTGYLETDKQLVGAIAIGYPAESPGRRPRKSNEEIIEFKY